MLVGVMAFVMAGGRLVAAESAAEQAARAAARIATSTRDGATAQRLARDTAESTLTAQGLACARLAVALDTSGLATPLSRPGMVRAEVTCAVRWSDLALPGAPGTRTISASFTSPVDGFRERTG
jgi:Flp pilus assembly protein TadG